MPDHNLTRALLWMRMDLPFRSRPILVLLILFVILLQIPGVQADQEPAAVPAFELPGDIAGGTWRSRDKPRILTAEQFAVVQGGEVFLEYGLERVIMRRYVKGSAAMTVEVFQMRFPAGAFGLYTFNRRALPSHRREFNAGQYLVSVSMENHAVAVDDVSFDAVVQLFAPVRSSALPPLVSHLPVQKKIPSSEKYLIGAAALGRIESFSDLANSIDFTGGVEVVTADYQTGDGVTRLIIIEYHTPQSASFGYDTAFNQLKAISEDEKARRILKRTGNYVVEALVSGDVAAAQSIVNEVKYQVVVYWEGSKFSSIPIQFRPPDPAAIEEFKATANLLIRTFYGIGFMLVASIVLGVFAGWTVFFWRKHRRRRLGTDDYFSDAGETIRLNLDDYVFQPNEQPIKLLGKGDV